jgi:hypothetical protein
VPAANIRAFLAPRPENQSLKDKAEALLEHSVERPEQAVLDNLIEKDFPTLKAGLLLFFWAGHGLITLADERRLFTADMTAASKRNLDLNAMMNALRSDRYPSLPLQFIIVDACANYSSDAASSLPHHDYGIGNGVAGREQFVLCATTAGEYAINRGRAGLMSSELVMLLEADAENGEAWPPNFQTLAGRLSQRFADMRADGTARQTPSTLWFRSPIASTGQFLSAVNARQDRSELPLAQYSELINAMLATDTMNDQDRRGQIVAKLGRNIAVTIGRSRVTNLDVMAIVDRCREYNGGLSKLVELIEFVENQSQAAVRLREVAARLLPAEIANTSE